MKFPDFLTSALKFACKSFLPGIVSLMFPVALLIYLLDAGIILNVGWYSGDTSGVILRLLSTYALIGCVLGLLSYAVISLLLRLLGWAAGCHPVFVINFTMVSIMVTASSLELMGSPIAASLSLMYLLFLLFLILVPALLNLMRDFLGLTERSLGSRLSLMLKVIVVIAVVLSIPLKDDVDKPPTGSGTTAVGSGKFIIIGFDGATWRLLQPLMEEGRLPNIKKLVDLGVSCNFTSMEYAGYIASPVVWTSIFTGKTPDKHGITEYTLYVLEDNLVRAHTTPPTSSFRKTKALWNILSEHNVSVGFVGLWSTWPAEEVNGFMVSDHLVYLPWHTNRSVSNLGSITYPEQLSGELSGFVLTPPRVGLTAVKRFYHEDALGYGYSEDVSDHVHTSQLNRIKLSYSLDVSYAESAKHLYRTREPDVLFVYLEGADILMHYFWGYMNTSAYEGRVFNENEVMAFRDTIPLYYEFYDELIGEFIDGAGEGTSFIILSDHGFEPVDPSSIEGSNDTFAIHQLDGVLIAAGPPFRRNATCRASVLDFTPTLLHVLGLPPASDMDGSVVLKMLKPGRHGDGNITRIPTYETLSNRSLVETPLQEDIKSRLREIGYIK
ncbi:MAG: alkaline phosphatase family protein [Candidatus Altiarchaeota archaeon]